MDELIKISSKLSRYELLNNLLPGLVLCYALSKIGYQIWADEWIINILMAYFVGMICSRFSSLCVETLMRHFNWIQWRDYDLYNKAKKERPFIALLQENANMYRSLSSAFFIALMSAGYYYFRITCPWVHIVELPLLLALLVILYLCSYIKQVNEYVVKNIDEVNSKK